MNLLLEPEQNNSDYNLTISKKYTSTSESLEGKNKLTTNPIVNNQTTREIYLFKNEILKEINDIIEKLIIKTSQNFKDINEKVSKNETMLKTTNERIDNLSEKTIKYDLYENDIKGLIQYKLQNEKEMNFHLSKFENIRREMKENFLEYDFIIKKYKEGTDEIIGEKRRFKTYPELIKYLYQNISKLNNAREKNNIEFQGYKTKLDSIISGFRGQINTIIETMKNFTINNVKQSEERIKGIFNLFDDRLVEIRSEISKNSEQMKKENEKYINDIITNIKEEVNKQLQTETLYLNDLLKKTQKKLEDDMSTYNNKFLSLRNDLENHKLNQNKRIEMLKKNINNIEKNSNDQNANIRAEIEKNKTHNDFFKPIYKLIDNDNINNSLQLDNLKRKFMDFFSNNNTINDEENKEKEEKDSDNFNNDADIYKENDNNIKKILLHKNRASANEFKNIFRIKKISNINKYKDQRNFSENIKDNNINNNKTDKSNKIAKNYSEVFDKDNDLPKIKDIKKDEVRIFEDTSKNFRLKSSRYDRKNKTTLLFPVTSQKKIKKSITINNLEGQKLFNEKQTDISLNNLDTTKLIEKKIKSLEEKNINFKKVNSYDVTFIPYKNYDRAKILKKEESKARSKIDDEYLLDKKLKHKQKKDIYNYINSKGEISNIIEMPPPENAIRKSIFGLD